MSIIILSRMFSFFFFFNDTAPTEIYTLSLHDALPISWPRLDASAVSVKDARRAAPWSAAASDRRRGSTVRSADRKSTRLNSSHLVISYAVFCLKKKKKNKQKTV